MADETDIERTEKLTRVYEDQKVVVAELNEKLRQTKENTPERNTLAKLAEHATDKLRELAKKIPLIGQIKILFNSGKESVSEFGQSMSGVGKSIGSISDGFLKIAKSNADLLVGVNSEKMRAMINPLAEAGSLVNSISGFKEMNEMLGNLAKTQTTVREAFIRTGRSIEEADAGAKEYPQDLRRIAVATGISTKALDEMNRSLNFLGPDALTPASKGLSDITGAIDSGLSPISTFATVARGMGMSTQEAVSSMSEAFMRFRQQPLDAARSLGVMAAAAKATDQDLGLTHKAIVDASSSLGIFGQKSDAAAGIWTTFKIGRAHV